HREVTGYVPEIPHNSEATYGKYLVDSVARCTSCHDTPATWFRGEEYLGGGKMVRTSTGEKPAPNITSSRVSGVGAWDEQEMIHYLRHGVTPDNKRVDASFCPVSFFANGSSEDVAAIAKYLRTVPPLD